MTNITDQDRRLAREWADMIMNMEVGMSPDKVTAARVILATVDAPAPTLAEELRQVAEEYNADGYPEPEQGFRVLADRAARMEHDLAEARAEVERERDLGVAVGHERDEVSEALAVERRRAEQIEQERDDASAEVERITAEHVTDPSPTLNDPSMTRHATVAREENVSHDLPEPADVKPGESWIVNIDGVEIVPGFKASVGWICYRFFGGTTKAIGDERITLVSRLVPAPRVITNPDELDRLAEGSIVRDRAGHAWERYPDEDWYSTEELDDGFSSRRLADYAGPVTVLWTPEETE